MYRGNTIGVVVPAYNEEAHVGTVLETIPSFVDRIYVVDDCSTDRTWEIVQEYAAGERASVAADASGATVGRHHAQTVPDGGVPARSRIVPLRHAENQGAGGALRTGYRQAYADGVDVTVTMDADGQMDPAQLPSLLDPIVEGVADYAKGNRLATRADWREMPPFRLFGNWALTVLTKLSSGYWRLQDPQNGYTAISHEALSAIDIDRIPDDHDYTNDVLVRLNTAGMRVADVSMPAVYGDEESSIDYRTFVFVTSATLCRGFFRRLNRSYLARGKPVVPVCYATGIGGGVVAAVAGAVAMAAAGGFAVGATAAAALTVALSALLVGFVAALAAVVLDARRNASLGVKC